MSAAFIMFTFIQKPMTRLSKPFPEYFSVKELHEKRVHTFRSKVLQRKSMGIPFCVIRYPVCGPGEIEKPYGKAIEKDVHTMAQQK